MISPVNTVSATSRFSNRAENYARFRPGYPSALFDFIEDELHLQPADQIVDIGSGTGLFAEPLLKRSHAVVCLEPNDEMRKAGEERLKKYPSFQTIRSTAEHTGLADRSIDLITIAQTFHWLDQAATKLECTRVLKPSGHVVLAWNRESPSTEFQHKYVALRNKYRMGEPGPVQIDPDAIHAFFAPGTYTSLAFENKQQLDFEGLKGQLLSKSYIPLPGHDTYDAMITELIQLFVAYNQAGLVTIGYETLLYWGKLH